MPEWIVFLRTAIKDSKYIISDHAFERMGQRGITIEDVERCVIEGQVVDKQGHGENVKWVLRERDEEGEIFFAIVALS